MASVTENRDTRRRFEQWAWNPQCEANTISAVHGIRMADVAKHEGAPPTMGQSPFAIARGETFEKALFAKKAERLRNALAEAGVLEDTGAEYQDFRLRMHGGRYRRLEDARTATSAFLHELGARKGSRFAVVASGATVCVPGGAMLPEAILVLDVLAARRDVGGQKPRLVVGEVKTYPDRAGYTDGKELALARAQAGVYVHGLRVVLEELELADKIDVSTRGFLILSRPGYNIPSVRAGEDFTQQAQRAARGFEMLRKAAALTPPPDPAKPWEAIGQAGTHYSENCLRFCDRAPVCRAQALALGDPAVLGDEMGRFLGEIRLHRSLELLAGAKAKTPSEEDLVRRLDEAELKP